MNENWDLGHANLWTKVADRNGDLHGILGGKGYRTSCDFPAAVSLSQALAF